jgi:GNAT superfamily N-acetyltransferase
MTITVRRLRASDRGGWQRLWDGYLAFYRSTLEERVSDETFARLCDGSALVGLVAVDGDSQIVGLANLIFHPSTWSTGPQCYLEDLFVDRAGRGGGIGERLIAAAYECARQRGADKVYWHTQQFNAPARSLYDTVATLTSFVVYEHELGQ